MLNRSRPYVLPGFAEEDFGTVTLTVDCLIATIALEHHVTLLYCDADFETMKTALSLKTCDWTPYIR